MTYRPVVFLKPLTPEAQLSAEGERIPIDTFPFRVGRESRNHEPPSHVDERRQNKSAPNNNLYLFEETHLIYVSREHFEIRLEGDEFWLVDRGSTLGTWVGGVKIGGHRSGGKVRIHHGDVIIVGSYKSGFIFQFQALAPIDHLSEQHTALELTKS